MSQAEIEQLTQEQESLRDQVMKLAAEISDLITRDIQSFMSREARKRFIQEPAFAESVDDGRLKELKQAIRARATQLSEGIKEALAAPALWLTQTPEPVRSKSLEPHAAIWAILQRIPESARELLAAFQFPEGEAPVYAPPSYFIEGKYLPGLVERYWTLCAKHQELEVRLGSLSLEARRKQQGERWDSV
jgi:hypothetical protein